MKCRLDMAVERVCFRRTLDGDVFASVEGTAIDPATGRRRQVDAIVRDAALAARLCAEIASEGLPCIVNEYNAALVRWSDMPIDAFPMVTVDGDIQKNGAEVPKFVVERIDAFRAAVPTARTELRP